MRTWSLVTYSSRASSKLNCGMGRDVRTCQLRGLLCAATPPTLHQCSCTCQARGHRCGAQRRTWCRSRYFVRSTLTLVSLTTTYALPRLTSTTSSSLRSRSWARAQGGDGYSVRVCDGVRSAAACPKAAFAPHYPAKAAEFCKHLGMASPQDVSSTRCDRSEILTFLLIGRLRTTTLILGGSSVPLIGASPCCAAAAAIAAEGGDCRGTADGSPPLPPAGAGAPASMGESTNAAPGPCDRAAGA